MKHPAFSNRERKPPAGTTTVVATDCHLTTYSLGEGLGEFTLEALWPHLLQQKGMHVSWGRPDAILTLLPGNSLFRFWQYFTAEELGLPPSETLTLLHNMED